MHAYSFVLLLLFVIVGAVQAAEWEIKPNPLMTSWGESIQPDHVWSEYPRPQMLRRDNWMNLNGLWDYAIVNRDGGETEPDSWQGKILVPFAAESSLSGVKKWVRPHQYLWYKRQVTLTKRPERTYLLHFEAVDYEASIVVNGETVGLHTGGNTPFHFDVTRFVKDGPNEIAVRVHDETDKRGGWQLVGKQTSRPSAIRYTQVTGIWQTVWLEDVPTSSIERLRTDVTIDPATITVNAFVRGDAAAQLRVRASFEGKQVAEAVGRVDGTSVQIPDAKLWSPSTPYLYDLQIELLNAAGEVLDTVESYAGLREVGRYADARGNRRFLLNGKPLFHWGPLDQGWWPDGLLTPPSDEAMVSELKFMKDCGFNMVRVHIKVQPRRYYHHCDKLGLLVWQDQVSGGPGTWWSKMRTHRRAPDKVWPAERQEQFLYELKEMIDHLYNSPAIVSWVPFNESWGQHNTVETAEWLMKYDATRHVNTASGGNFWPVGHIADGHAYPDPGFPLHDTNFTPFIKVIGEFGGYGFTPDPKHLWNAKAKHHGYGGKMADASAFEERVWKGIKILDELRKKGVAGAVYTQITDVENEINGLLTYDRKLSKIPVASIRKMSELLLQPQPSISVVLARVQDGPVEWQYVTERPADNWYAPAFDASSWAVGKGAFGKDKPGGQIQTEWTHQVWLRREFVVADPTSIGRLCLSFRADDEAVFYLNGEELARAGAKGPDYTVLPIKNLLKPGKNLLAVHAVNKKYAAYVDVGLVDVAE